MRSIKMDLISILELLPIVENIFRLLSSKEIDTMTRVSRRWRGVVYNNKYARKRLQRYAAKRIRKKENSGYIHVPQRSIHKRINTCPLTYFNKQLTITSNVQEIRAGPSYTTNSAEHQKAISSYDNELLVYCPSCGSGSKIQHSQIDSHKSKNTTTILDSVKSPKYLKNVSVDASKNIVIVQNMKKHLFHKFFSISPQIKETNYVNSNIGFYGECLGVSCNYKFCLRCLYKYHPGEICRLSVMGTPSKVLLTGERKTPVDKVKKSNLKITRTALRRLCF